MKIQVGDVARHDKKHDNSGTQKGDYKTREYKSLDVPNGFNGHYG